MPDPALYHGRMSDELIELGYQDVQPAERVVPLVSVEVAAVCVVEQPPDDSAIHRIEVCRMNRAQVSHAFMLPPDQSVSILVSRVVSNLTVRSGDTGVCRLLRRCCSGTVTREG